MTRAMPKASSGSSACRSRPARGGAPRTRRHRNPRRRSPRHRIPRSRMSDNGAPEVWRGRLGEGLDPRARALNDSLPVDRRLWPEELALSRAYAASLLEAGVLQADEHEALIGGCAALERGLESGAITLAGEDIHSAVEAELTRLCGDPGRKLHTGR